MKRSLLLAACAAVVSGPAAAADVEVIHWWTSGGEQAAVKVFADEFNAGGDHWVDTAIALGENARAAVMQRALGGDPPDAAQFNPGRQYEELIEGGLLLDLTDLAEQEGWRDFIRPDSTLAACEKDGHIWCVPVNIHSWQWGWASVPVFEQSGVAIPRNIDEFLAEAPKIREAGFIPFALGGEAWQQNGALRVIMLGQLGAEGYYKIYRDRDLDFIRGPEVRHSLETWRQLMQYTDEGSANRNWNDTTNLVITDRAALQIMGDWARGEFALAGEVPGTDYECLPGGPSDQPHLDTGGDIFVFFKQDDPEVEAAQLRLASMMVSPRVQALFNLAKGSLPVRDDVDLSLADSCMLKGIEILKNPDSVVPALERFLTEDTIRQLNDLWTEYTVNTAITPEEAQDRFASIIETAS